MKTNLILPAVRLVLFFLLAFLAPTASAQSNPTIKIMSFNIYNYNEGFWYVERIYAAGIGIPYWTVGSPTYNGTWESIGNGRQRMVGRRLKQIVDIVKEQNPAVIGLQEAYEDQVGALKLLLPNYDSVGKGREGDGKGESVSILYDKTRIRTATGGSVFGIPLPEAGTFWLSSEPSSEGSTDGGSSWGWHTRAWWKNIPRIVTWVGLEHKATDKKFYVYNTHMQNDSGATDANLHRVKSVKLLLERIDDKVGSKPVLITGDFNAEMNESPIRHMTSASITTNVFGHDIVWTNPYPVRDAYRVVHPNSDAGTRCHNEGFPIPKADWGGKRIDYVFVSQASKVNVLSASRITQIEGTLCPSDHLPFIAEVELLSP
jgi:endonuclease/exonuclease/phosphatase family metal-dependent hydrolase